MTKNEEQMRLNFHFFLKKITRQISTIILVLFISQTAFGFNIYFENNNPHFVIEKTQTAVLMDKVTFEVDMRNESVDPQGVFFASNFQSAVGGSNWSPVPMCDLGTGIWQITFCNVPPSPNPTTDQYKFLNGPGGWEFTGAGSTCTNPADNNNRFVDISGGSQTEGPYCFETCDILCAGMGNPGGSDNTPPVILNPPSNMTITCGDPLPDPDPLDAEDDCDVNCTLETDPANDNTSQLNSCGLGQITRTWEVTDCAGNTSTATQIINIVDDAFGTCICDASCNFARPCDDGDPCTTGEMETVGIDGTVCVPCAGGVVGGCDATCTTVRNCDDGDPCTDGEFEEIGPDGGICFPCGDGIISSSCDAPCAYTLPCDDFDPCTTDEYEVYAADGSICEPCGNGVGGGCDPACLETIVFTNSSTFCRTANLERLTATPLGGTWSGDVNNLGFFLPDSLGADTFRAIYTFVNGNSCVIIDSTEFIIVPSPKISFEDTFFCLSANVDTLIASPFGGKWSGAVDTLGRFIPDTLGSDTFKAFYTFVDTFNCEIVDSFEFIILPDLNIIFGDSIFCKNEGAQTLTANPSGGIWSGVGINPSGEIEPQLLATGNHIFTYTFQRLPDSCTFFKNLKVEIQNSPSGSISGNNSFCATSGIQTFSGTPAGGTWGGVANAAGEVDPTTLSIGVNQISYTYSNAICTQTLFQDLNLSELPTATLSGGGNICAGGTTEIDLEITLTGTAPWEIIYTLNSTSQVPVTINTNPFLLTTGQAGNYELTTVTDASGCQNTASGMATITEFTPLTISNLMTDCNATNTGFNMQFEITGGDPSSYQISGATGMISSTPPYIFSSQNNPPSTDIVVIISDGSSCPAISETIRVDCSCDTEVGSMDLTAGNICIPDIATSSYDQTGEFLDGDDVIEFVLHTNSGLTLGTILKRNNTLNFDFDSGIMIPGTTYYISAVIGNNDGTGNVDLTDNCLKVSAGTPITFYEQPEAILSGDQSICVDSIATLQIQFSGEPPFNVQYSNGTTTNDLNGITSNIFDFTVMPNANTTYNLVSISNNFCPTGQVSGSANIAILETPTVSDVTVECDPTNTNFTVRFTVNGGDPTSYAVSGGTGSFSGAIFTSDPILSGENYAFILTDGNRCGEVIIDGSHQCLCDTDAGSFQPNNFELCDEETAEPVHNFDQNLDGDDGFIFVLHDGSAINLGTILMQNGTSSFDFDSNVLSFENQYFITAIAGNSDRGGGIDSSDPCLSFAEGIPVIWHQIPDADLEHDGPICAGDSITLTFRLSGVAPFNLTLNYNGTNQNFTGISDGHQVRIQLNSTTNFFARNLSDAHCAKTSSSGGSIRVIQPPTAEVTASAEICNSSNAGDPTTFDFSTLITAGDVSGNWVDFNGSGATGSFPNIDFNGISPGDYRFEYTTNSADLPCSEATYEVTMTVRDCACPSVTTTAPTAPFCNDNAMLDLADLTVTTESGSWSIFSAPSGSTAILSGNIFDATSSEAGDYILQFSLDNPVAGCPENSMQTVTIFAPPNATISPIGIICNSTQSGDPTTFDFSTLINAGDASGSWVDLDGSGVTGSFPNIDFNGISPGDYRFEYTTNSANPPCSEATYEVTMTVRDCACPSVTTTAPTSAFCNDNAMLNLADLTVTTEPGSWSIFSAPSGSTATLSGNIFDATSSEFGDYILQFSLDNPVAGCPENSMQTVTVFAPPSATSSPTGMVCNSAQSGDPTTFDFSTLINAGDASGNWVDLDGSGATGSFPNLDFNGISPGNYRFEYTTNSANPPCSEATYEVTMIVRDCACPSVTTTAPTAPFCNDNAMLDLADLTVTTEPGSWSIFSAPSGSTASISGNNFDATNSVSGDYELSFTLDSPVAGCPESSTQIVQIVAALSAGSALVPIEFCEDFDTLIALFSILDNEDFGGVWTDISTNPQGGFDANNATFNSANLAPSSYRFQYEISGNGICPNDSETVEIIIHELPIANAGLDQELTCEIREVTIGGATSTSGNDINYSWSGTTSDPMILMPKVTAPGTYILTIENTQTNCSATDEVNVVLNGDLPILDASPIEITCFGLGNGIIQVNDVSGGNAPYLYSLNGQPFSDKNEFTGLTAGDYILTVEDVNGCKDEIQFTINEPDEVSVELTVNLSGGSNIISLGDSALLSASVLGIVDSISWSPSEAFEPCDPGTDLTGCLTQWVSPQTVTTYSIFVSNEKGCSNQSELTLDVANNIDVFMPQAFSPNDDGINDIFYVNAGARITRVKTLAVFSRWGDQLFTVSDVPPNDPFYGWDGKFRGKTMNSGVYAFFTEVELSNGATKIIEGDLTLLK